MDRTSRLDAIVAANPLNEHPFYVAWRAGTLPRAALADYAAEYGLFIAELARGWDAVGEPSYADEERRHAALWDDFRADLDARAPASSRETTRALLGEASALFASRPEALGALWAFEAQQPATATSKLEGLRAHRARYAVGERGQRYFVEHARETGELEKLAAAIAALDEGEFARATAACERMCHAMLRGLDGVTPAECCTAN